MLIKEVFTSVLEILKGEIGSINSHPELTKLINCLPPREFNSSITVKIAHSIAEGQHCDITLLSSENHAKFAEDLGRLLARLAKIHARKCVHCDPPNAAFNFFGLLLNKYVFQDVSGGAPVNLPGGGSFIVVALTHPTESSDTTASAENLKENVRNWDITGNKK